MEFSERLKRMRTERKITQQELADKLYISRTAVSKWESGRGFPSIESLKAIAVFFSVTLDELLSPGEAVRIAEADALEKRKRFALQLLGLLDLGMLLLLFLPLFAVRSNGAVTSASLLSLFGVRPYLRVAYFIAVIGVSLVGALFLVLRCIESPLRGSRAIWISLSASAAATALFAVSAQPYAASFSLALLLIKAVSVLRPM